MNCQLSLHCEYSLCRKLAAAGFAVWPEPRRTSNVEGTKGAKSLGSAEGSNE